MTESLITRTGLNLEIETAPENITIHVHGQRFGIGVVNQGLSHCAGKLSLIVSMRELEGESERTSRDASEGELEHDLRDASEDESTHEARAALEHVSAHEAGDALEHESAHEAGDALKHVSAHEAEEASVRKSGHVSALMIPPNFGAVVISQAFQVLRIVEPKDESISLALPPNELVLTADYRLFNEKLSDLFHIGDTVKLRNHGEVITYEELQGITSTGPYVKSHQAPLYSEVKPTTIISGCIAQHRQLQQLKVYINGTEITVDDRYQFSSEYKLTEGINEFTVQLHDGLGICDSRNIAVYHLASAAEQKRIFLWVEQGHNLVTLSVPGAVRAMLQQAKKAGVTAIVVDVKGIEGFAGYKHNKLTGRPYASSMQAPGRSGANPNIDLLLEFTTVGKEIGIEIYAAFNVFAEGSYYRNEFGLPQLLDSGGQYVLHPDDGGSITRHQESEQVRNGKAKIAYVNPADDHSRAIQLNTIAEVIQHYDITGVVLDRCRYDDEYADFSEATREKFAAFVEKKGSRLIHWPADIFIYKDGVRIAGPLSKEWWEFRATVITSFVQEVRALIDTHNAKQGSRVQLATYVGSWYEYAYRYGINWASKAFQYNEAFHWPEEEIYTSDYASTGYIDGLDFIIIGAYQQTLREVEHYITMAHIVTNGETLIITGIALPYVQESARFPAILQAGLSQSAGVMLFDHCHIKWQAVEQALLLQANMED